MDNLHKRYITKAWNTAVHAAFHDSGSDGSKYYFRCDALPSHQEKHSVSLIVKNNLSGRPRKTKGGFTLYLAQKVVERSTATAKIPLGNTPPAGIFNTNYVINGSRRAIFQDKLFLPLIFLNI